MFFTELEQYENYLRCMSYLRHVELKRRYLERQFPFYFCLLAEISIPNVTIFINCDTIYTNYYIFRMTILNVTIFINCGIIYAAKEAPSYMKSLALSTNSERNCMQNDVSFTHVTIYADCYVQDVVARKKTKIKGKLSLKMVYPERAKNNPCTVNSFHTTAVL